mmetsp:Transcript_29837/g.114567  ORF Transcript_29837/g.114567 Transcript_29837/m.114567 type:complete len:96 (+) Transcript_29837:139-426(+)
MEGLDTEGIEFYDDTSGVPSHGFTSEVTPKAGDERRGGREILPGDDGGKREYERRMSPFGMDDSRGFQTLFGKSCPPLASGNRVCLCGLCLFLKV